MKDRNWTAPSEFLTVHSHMGHRHDPRQVALSRATARTKPFQQFLPHASTLARAAGESKMGMFDDFLTNFNRGLGVLGDTYQSHGAGGVAGQLYGATGQNFKTGLGLGQTPEETAASLQNLGVNRKVALGVGGGANALADALNPLGYMTGQAAGGAIGDVLSTPAARQFIASEAGSASAPASLSSAARRLPQVVGADKATMAIGAEGGGINESLLPTRQRLFTDLGPDFGGAMQKVPAGSRFLGEGAEGVALRTPQGDVARIGFPTGSVRNPVAPAPALNLPEVLQPTSDAVVGATRVSRFPFAQNVGTAGEPVAEGAASALRRVLQGRGYDPWDVYGPNVGQVGGQWKVIDPGAVLPN